MNTAKTVTYHSYFTFFTFAAFYVYTLTLQAMPELYLHQWRTILNTDLVNTNFLLVSFFYTYVPAQLLAGIVYDRFNIKHLLLIGILLCALSASICGIAASPLFALVSRLLLGIGSAFASIGFLVVLSQRFPARKFATFASALPVLIAVSALTINHYQAFVLATINWKWVFLALSLLGLLLAGLAGFSVKTQASQAVEPLLPQLRAVFYNAENWVAVVYAFAIWMPLTIFSGLWGAPYLQARYLLTPETALLAVSMVWIGLALGAPIAAAISDITRRRRPVLMFCAFIGLVSILTLLFNSTLSLRTACLLLLLLGIASAGQNLAIALVHDHNPVSCRGTAFGFISLAMLIGGALFDALVSFLLDWHWNGQQLHSNPVFTTMIYQRALIVLVPCYGIALFVSALLLREEH